MLPSNCANRFLSIVWYVMPTTWHTNFLMESSKPMILLHRSPIVTTLSQNIWKSHCSKISAKYIIWLIESSCIWNIIFQLELLWIPTRGQKQVITIFSLSRHLHRTKSVCGRFVMALSKIWQVMSTLKRAGLSW